MFVVCDECILYNYSSIFCFFRIVLKMKRHFGRNLQQFGGSVHKSALIRGGQ